MADLKENELTQKNDFNFVRGLDAAGNSILINKADLVKVVEGLIPELDTMPLFDYVKIPTKGWWRLISIPSNCSFVITVGCVHQYVPNFGSMAFFNLAVSNASVWYLTGKTVSGFRDYRIVKDNDIYYVEAYFPKDQFATAKILISNYVSYNNKSISLLNPIPAPGTGEILATSEE